MRDDSSVKVKGYEIATLFNHLDKKSKSQKKKNDIQIKCNETRETTPCCLKTYF